MNKNYTSLKLAILTMSVVQLGTNGISPILAQIAAAFPAASVTTVQFLMTFPSIFSMICTLLSAFMAEKLHKKTLAVSGLSIVAAGGFLAFLFHGNLFILYVWAGLIGIGLGMTAPVAPSLINSTFSGGEMKNMLGWQNSAANIGSMIMTFAGGFLAAAGWNFGYLVYLIAIPGIIFTIKGVNGSSRDSGLSSSDISCRRPAFRLVIWREMIIVCVFLAAYSAVPVNMSMLMEENGLGGASVSGVMSAVFMLAGTVMGLAFGQFTKIFRQFTDIVGMLSLAAGAFLMAVSTSMFMMIYGCFVAGLSMAIVMPSCMAAGSRLKGYETINTAILMSVSHVGAFISPLITSISAAVTGSSASSYRFMVISILCVILAIATIFLKSSAKREKGHLC